jgi:TfoX/Sxy family transcriptional regulator of competence genes
VGSVSSVVNKHWKREKKMPYNEEIDERIKKIVSRWKNRDAKKMFSGVCHLLNGNMFCGVYKDYLILRLGE